MFFIIQNIEDNDFLSHHNLKENQSPSAGQSKPQSSAGHMVRPPPCTGSTTVLASSSPVRNTCMHTPALLCTVLYCTAWCIICFVVLRLINVPLPPQVEEEEAAAAAGRTCRISRRRGRPTGCRRK